MESTLPFMVAALVGFGHAFEADHLVAVGSIVTKRDRLRLAIKDGVYWGLGHTSTIILIGMIMIVGKTTFLNGWFGYFEAAVGLMLVWLGFFRLYQHYKKNRSETELMDTKHDHHLAYSVGFVHGLAGSGAMILLVMTELNSSFNGMLYLLIFGLGSVAGMLVAAGIFSMPFSKRLTRNYALQVGLIIISSAVCIGYGGFVFFENLV